jgi:hypothetical protein
MLKIKDKYSGKELNLELLPNGILKGYDYECQWDVTFKKNDQGTWESHFNGHMIGYRNILQQLNSK